MTVSGYLGLLFLFVLIVDLSFGLYLLSFGLYLGELWRRIEQLERHVGISDSDDELL